MRLKTKCYSNLTDLNAFYPEHSSSLSAQWRLVRCMCDQMYIMAHDVGTGISYAPFYHHSFQLIQPYFSVQMEKGVFYSSLSEIPTIADKLSWCRCQKGLLQRDVADYAGLDRGTYENYEKPGRDRYPIDKMIKIAELFDVPIVELLDDYNLFLYNGQGAQLKALRTSKGLSITENAAILNVPRSRLSKWENNSAAMHKSTWEQLFKDDLTGLAASRRSLVG